MSAIESISVGVDALKRNPVQLYAVGAIIAVGGGLVVGSQHLPAFGFLLGLVVGGIWLFVEPYVAGGYLAMLDEALDGEASYDALKEGGKENYFDLLVGRILVLVAEYGLWFLVVVGIFVLFFVFVGAAIGAAAADVPELLFGAGTVVLLGIFVVVVGAWLLTIVVGFFVQFYAVVIVLEDEDFVQGFRRSASVVKENPLSVLGYSVIVWVVQFVVAIPTFVAVSFRDFGRTLLYEIGEGELGEGSPLEDVIGEGLVGESATEFAILAEGFGFGMFFVILGVLLLMRTLTIPILRAYHVAFYRSITGR